MPDWGTHGEQTADLWDQFFRYQQLTAAFASGTYCPTVQFQPYEERVYDDVPGTTRAVRDQAAITGGVSVRGVELHNPSTGLTTGEGATSSPGERATLAAEVTKDAIQRLMYPWEFFKIGQQMLQRLKDIKPAPSASLESRFIWAVDAAWWINMMLASTNVYPSWIPNALGMLLQSSWHKVPWVPKASDLNTVPSLWGGGDTSWPYAIPFADDPGPFNTSGLIVGAAPNPFILARVQRWVMARPWWAGIEQFLAPDAFAPLMQRANTEDPRQRANLLRAVAQHTFFQVPGGGDTRDFFATIDSVRSDARLQSKFAAYVDGALTNWINVMISLPYWQIVRAGNDSWTWYATGLDVSLRNGDPQDLWRFPMTAYEAREQKRQYDAREEQAFGMALIGTYLVSFSAIIQTASGTLSKTHLDALKSWYSIATWKYKEPKLWERSWEPPPPTMRVIATPGACFYTVGQHCVSSGFAPEARATDVGASILSVAGAYKYLSTLGDIALTIDYAPPGAADFEARTDQVLQVSSAEPTPSAPVPAPAPQVTTAFQLVSKKRLSALPFIAVAVVGAIAGTLYATRKRS